MPLTSVKLQPGVNVERTPTLNEAGVTQSQLLRYKDGILQTYGGWASILAASPSTCRDLHAWKDTGDINWLSAAGTQSVLVANSTSSQNITPQTRTSDFSPNFSVSSGTTTIIVSDPNAGPSVYNTVFFNTPVALSNLLLNGAYDVVAVLSTGSFTINASLPADITVLNGGILPIFNTNAGTAIVNVTLPNNNFLSVPGGPFQQTFRAPTSVGGLTIEGPYDISSIIDSTAFTITAVTAASSTATATMNASLAELVYYVTAGPTSSGSGFGAGGFGLGGFGFGTSGGTAESGTPITADNWSQDNWGEVLLACPTDGPIWSWSPHGGLFTMQVVSEAPFFNGGIFISMPQQILVAWKSTQTTGTQDNLIVRWSDAGNFHEWTVSNLTSAGSFRIPTGSIIVGGLQAPNYGVIWTDVDVWIMQYVGGDVIFNFTRAGSGCGLIGQHAAGVLSNDVYWCGVSNFFRMGAGGMEVMNCSVWDYIFQNISPSNFDKVVCAPNGAFNEITWFFPSVNATECDSYVKYNILEGEWDYGALSRTAWTDVSVFGTPIGAENSGTLYQHEVGQAVPGASATSFRTGWWAISDGNEIAFLDWLLPDFQWGLFPDPDTAQVNITLFAQDYPGDNPRTYGPFTVTAATQYINPRLRGRLVSMLVTSNNNVFWRLGRVRFRVAQAGRR